MSQCCAAARLQQPQRMKQWQAPAVRRLQRHRAVDDLSSCGCLHQAGFACMAASQDAGAGACFC